MDRPVGTLTQMRRLSLLLILLVACSSGTATQTTQPGPTTSGTAAPPTTDGPPAPTTSVVAGELTAEIRQLQEVTERVRGLRFLEEPRLSIVSGEELAQRVRDQIEEDVPFDEVVVDQALLELMGLLEPDTDLLTLYQDLYAEQVAGFYDGDTGEMVVGASTELSVLNRITIVHELVHALTDQHFGFHELLVRLDEEERFDEVSALQALVEGDATHYQTVYLRDELSREDQLRAVLESLEIDTSVLDQAPRFLQDLLQFPYTTGSTFVSTLVQSGGQQAVDSAYGEPPISTEQVIETSAYFEGEVPLTPELPAVSLDRYEVAEDSVWGQLGFQVMLADVLGSSAAVAPSEGWGGDRYQVLWEGGEVAFLLVYVGDSSQDAAELEEAMAEYVEEAMAVGAETETASGRVWEGEDYAFLIRDAERLTLVMASDPAAGRSLAEGL